MGNSTYTFEVSGPATGPYACTFTESGSVTIGPQVDPIPGAPGQFRGPITAYESTFTVTSPAGNIADQVTRAWKCGQLCRLDPERRADHRERADVPGVHPRWDGRRFILVQLQRV